MLLWTPPPAAAVTVEECKGTGTPSAPNGCGDISNTGCCDALGRALWCDNGDLYCNDCTDGFEHCGWFKFLDYYDCGAPGSYEDPSGNHPYACGTPCGDCQPDEVCLDDGTCYLPQCQGKECGKDPKGISCGTCEFGTECVDGLFQCLPYPEPCLAGDGPGCDWCACESCVCDKYPHCCTEKWDIFCAAACEQECGFDCSPCPATPSCEGIECGGFCGVDCGSCPADQVCYGAICCTPDCAGGKECGADGCGGSCGDCPDGWGCSGGQCTNQDSCVGNCDGQADGGCYCDEQCKSYGDCCDDVCEACPHICGCEPDCAGKDCGDDECGGSCGDCDEGLFCHDFTCQADECGELTWEGCCKDNILHYCQQGQALEMDCNNEDGPCGWEAENTYYNCSTSGEPDPSGEFPMACPGGCEPDCADKACGPDGCEGTCGDCPTKQMVCLPDGTCCAPDCLGKACGDDACGGTCGDCPDGATCIDGQCPTVSDPGVMEPTPEPVPEAPDGTDTLEPDGVAEPMPDVLEDTGNDTGGSQDLNINWKDLGTGDKGQAGTDLSSQDTGSGSSSNCSALAASGPGGGVPPLVLGALLFAGLFFARRRPLGAASIGAVVLAFQVTCSSDGPGLVSDNLVPHVDATETNNQDVKPEGLAKPDLKTDMGTPDDIPDLPEDPGPVDSMDLPEEPGLPDVADLPDASDTFDLPEQALEIIDDTGVEDVPDIPDVPDTPDVASDPGMEATDALDASEEIETVPPYDCSQIPPGPFNVVNVPNAVASEDLAFDGQGYLVGSDNYSIYKTGADGAVKLFAPNVKTRSAMRMLPNGTLAVNDDKKGRVLLFDPDGVMTVLVTGLSYPNGMAVDLQGYIYVAEENANRVIRIHSYTGEYTVLTKAISHPNGITFNATYDRLYVGSFGSPKIYTLTISPDGTPGKVTVFHEFPSGSLMDGMGVDVCGNVYVCEYNKTEIWRITSDGKHKKRIVDPDVSTYLPNLQWGRGAGWDPLSIYVPDGWAIGVWRVEIGVPSAPLPFP